MPRLFNIRPIYCLFVFSLFMLGGCQTLDTAGSASTRSDRDIEAETDLETELAAADVQGVEVSSGEEGELSPLERHMMARGDVDPTHVNHKNRYTKTVEDYRREELARASGEAKPKSLKIAADPVKKQEQAKSYVETILAKHKARQEALSNDENKVAVVQPQKKPSLKPSSDVQVMAGQTVVNNVRIGQHPGKTRIVMDVSDKPQFQTRFENNDQTLVVMIPATSWRTQESAKVAGQSLVTGYDAANSGSGYVVKIAMREPSKLAYQNAIRPSGERGHRIVLDVVAK